MPVIYGLTFAAVAAGFMFSSGTVATPAVLGVLYGAALVGWAVGEMKRRRAVEREEAFHGSQEPAQQRYQKVRWC